MTSIGDIFDLPEGQTLEEPKKEKKPRKKVEMSDEKKSAMLERLAKGREVRAQKIAEKKGDKVEKVDKVEKIEKVVNKKEIKEVSEDERLSFIKMMAGKSKPIENNAMQKRPKKKVYSLSNTSDNNKPIQEEKKEEPKTEPKKTETHTAPNVVAPTIPIAPIVKQPVIIRTFKKPIWA